MKKIFTQVFICLISNFCIAQEAILNYNQAPKVLEYLASKEFLIAEQKTKQTNTTEAIPLTHAAYIWSDDFSNASTWEFGHASSCDLDWEIGVGLENEGNYPTPTINSTTAADGYAMLDADEYINTQPNDVISSWMTTASPINLSANPNVILQFETQYRPLNSKCFVVTSTNNTDWPELNVNFDASTNENVYELFQEVDNHDLVSNSSTLIELNISASSGGQEQVWVRFHFTGIRYSWFVDDAAIIDFPDHDIRLKSGWITNENNRIEYGRIPASQMNDTLIVGSEIFNFGAENQTNINVNVIISDQSNNEITNDSFYLDNIESNNSSYLQAYVTNFSPLAVGNYSLNITTSSDMDNASGENFANNNYSRNFAVTENLYSLDGIGLFSPAYYLTMGTTNFTNNHDGFILMNYYTIHETTEISGLEVGIHPNSIAGAKIFPFIISADEYDDGDVYNRIVENEEGVIVTQTHINNNSVFATLPTSTLEPGEYFVGVELFSNNNENDIYVQDDVTITQPSLASSIYLPNQGGTNAPGKYSNGNAFAIRMVLNNNVAIEENTLKTLFSIYPNPSNGVFTVSSDEANTYTIEVINILGEIVSVKTIEGIINETFNISDYNAGLYFVKVSNESSENIKKIIIK